MSQPHVRVQGLRDECSRPGRAGSLAFLQHVSQGSYFDRKPGQFSCPEHSQCEVRVANGVERGRGEGYRAWNSLYYDKSPVGQRNFSSVLFVFPMEGGSCGPQPFVNSFPKSLACE